MTHERAQEIDPIGARDLPCDLARNLDIASSVDEKAGSAEGEGGTGERRGRVAQPAPVGGLDEQPCGLRDLVVDHGAMLEERFHQPIRERDLRSNLLVVISMNRFQSATQELVNVAGQEFGAGCGVGRVNVYAPAFLKSRVDLRLKGGGEHVLVDAGTEPVRHNESRLASDTGITRGTPRSCAIPGTRAPADPSTGPERSRAIARRARSTHGRSRTPRAVSGSPRIEGRGRR